MPQIPDFINTQASTPLLNSGEIDPNVGTAAAQNDVQNKGKLLNQAMSQYDQATAQATRAQLIANEQQHALNLALPTALNSIEQSKLGAISTIAAIAEAQQQKQEEQQAVAFSTNQSMGLQSKLVQFQIDLKKNSPANGEGYAIATQNFINQNLEAAMASAPSMKAKLSLFEKTAAMSVNTVNDALKYQNQLSDNYNKELNVQAAGYITNQVLDNPDIAEASISQIPDLIQSSKDSGIGAAAAEKLGQDTLGRIRSNQVQGLINNGRVDDALNVLKNETVMQQMDPKQYESAYTSATKAKIATTNEQAKVANKAITADLFSKNLLNKKDTGFNDVADQHFQAAIGDTSTTSIQDVGSVATKISTYFQTYNKGLGTVTQNILHDKMAIGANPAEAIAVAIGIDNLRNGQSQSGRNILTQLDADTALFSSRIASLANSGVPAQQAIDLARTEMSAQTDPSKKVLMEVLAKDVNTIDNAKALIKDTIDNWYTSYDENTAVNYIPLVTQAMTSYIAKYNNIDLAKAATQDLLRKTVGVSKVNGYVNNNVMEAAPETYFDDNMMEIFKEGFGDTRKQIFDQLGYKYDASLQQQTDKTEFPFEAVNEQGNNIRLELRAIRGVTINQGPNNKTYAIWDANSNTPIFNTDGRLAQYTFGTDETSLGKIRQEQVQAASERRNQINAQADIIAKSNGDYYAIQNQLAKQRTIAEQALGTVK